eukprot:7315918-Pyramimonas_sp.AAC.1
MMTSPSQHNGAVALLNFGKGREASWLSCLKTKTNTHELLQQLMWAFFAVLYTVEVPPGIFEDFEALEVAALNAKFPHVCPLPSCA